MQKIRIPFFILITVVMAVFNDCYGQAGDEEETVEVACLPKPQNKKVLKLYLNSKDRKKTFKERYKMLKDALEIDEQINEQRSLADKRDSLSERIAEIEGTVQRAKSGYELSDLL